MDSIYANGDPTKLSREGSGGTSKETMNTFSAQPGTSKHRAPAKMCRECQEVIQKVLRISASSQSSPAKHHETYTAVKLAAKNGCAVCSLFLRKFTIFQETEPQRNELSAWISGNKSSFTWRMSIPRSSGDPATPKATHEQDGDQDPKGRDCFNAVVQGILTTSQSKIRYYLKVYRLTKTFVHCIGLDYDSTPPNTRDALAICKWWFQNCCDTHSTCDPSPTSSVRASLAKPRFLSVSNGEFRLCSAEEVQSNSQYAALSHCWGSLKFTTLTKSNLDSFRNHIPPAALPKTFRNAVDICRYLGIPYLWIDSLCIIQDSEEDWAIQSALMAQIYGDCDLNIAATSAPNGSVGCFFDRPNQWLVQVSSISEGKTWTYDILPVPLVDAKDDLLATRGWVVQERYLSKRTLHFTSTQIFWECNGGSVCETCPHGYPDAGSTSTYRDFDRKRRYTVRSDWMGLLTLYLSTKLTKSSDRLIAMEGLTRTIQSISNDRYVAGMWVEWIDKQLAWFCHDFRPDPSAKAPSWSWASGSGEISGTLLGFSGESDYHKSTHIALYDIQVEYESQNTFRGVNSALIRLSCTHLFHALLQPSQDLSSTRYNVDFGVQRDFDDIYVNLDFVDASQRGQVIPVYVLVITETCGLFIQPTNRSNGQFIRIGSYMTLGHSYIEALSPKNCVGKLQPGIFSDIIVNKDSTKLYIIDLV